MTGNTVINMASVTTEEQKKKKNSHKSQVLSKVASHGNHEKSTLGGKQKGHKIN